MTDKAILDVLGAERTHIVWLPKTFLPFHPNGMKFRRTDAEGHAAGEWTVFSIGGGALAEEGQEALPFENIYPISSATEILSWCMHTGKSYWEYVEECEGAEIWDYLAEVWTTMRQAVQNGLDHEGVLPARSACAAKPHPTSCAPKATSTPCARGGSSSPTPWP